MKLKTESLIFDMDGTLWDSAANVAASWNEELRRNGSDVTSKGCRETNVPVKFARANGTSH